MHSPDRFVKAALVAKGVSLTEIARRSGEDVQTVSHILKGRRTNRAEPVLIEVALATGLKLGDLKRMYGDLATPLMRAATAPGAFDTLASMVTKEVNGCWLFVGRLLGKYPILHLNGEQVMAHRAMYVAVHGSIPDGLHICHKCDTPRCICPDHLFAGTPKENTQDSIAKGRHPSVTRRKSEAA